MLKFPSLLLICWLSACGQQYTVKSATKVTPIVGYDQDELIAATQFQQAICQTSFTEGGSTYQVHVFKLGAGEDETTLVFRLTYGDQKTFLWVDSSRQSLVANFKMFNVESKRIHGLKFEGSILEHPGFYELFLTFKKHFSWDHEVNSLVCRI